MSDYRPLSASDWIWMLVFIFGAAVVNRVLTWATDLPFSDLAVTQTIAVLAIFAIDRVYDKLVMFLAVYAGLALFAEDTIYALVFSAVVFGVVLHRVANWRHYHQVRKAKEYMEK